jgi:hypothetical protein
MIALAEKGLAAAETRQAAWDKLERLDLELQSASLTLAEMQAEQAAWEALYVSDGAPEPDDISAHLDEASENLELGRPLATALRARHPDSARDLIARVRIAHARIADLRARLEYLRERMEDSPS